MSIETVTWDRVEDGLCVKCGEPLISIKDAELLMCTECGKAGQKAAMKLIRNFKSRKGNVKKKYIVLGGGKRK